MTFRCWACVTEGGDNSRDSVAVDLGESVASSIGVVGDVNWSKVVFERDWMGDSVLGMR